LARSGEPGKALALAAYASFAGGTLAALMLIIAAPILADLSLIFQSADYFALMLLGLSLVAAFARPGGHLKALLMACFGIMLSTVGTDLSAGVQRFTFGRMDLMDGISFLLLAMATFALAEALMMVLQPTRAGARPMSIRMSRLKLNKREIKQVLPTVGRASVLGFFVGVLPGAGATIASFLAYGVERVLAKPAEQLRFGKGSLKGLAAPETANNAACTGSFVPLLTLGIPGSGTTAILLGALLAYGIQPGPRLFVDEPQVFWAVIVSMYFGNLILLVLNLPLIPYIARILMLPKVYLVPAILFFSLIGVYLVSFNSFDIQMMVFIAVIAVGLRLLEFPMAPLLLGFILGGMLEDNLRRAIILSDGSFGFLLGRPTTVVLLSLTVVTLISPLLRKLYRGIRSGN
jgi:putative tricarboxylic transport membrane protein